MSEYKQLWERVLGEIETQVSRPNFSTWFKNTHITKHEDGIIYLGTPNEFVRDWISNKHHKMILRLLRDFSEGVRGVEYVVARNIPKEPKDQGGADKKELPANELPLQDLYIDKKDNLNPKYTFDSFVIGSFNDLAHAASQAVLKNPGREYNPLFIHGGTGLGKTHLIQAVGNHLKEHGKKVHYITSEQFAVMFINALQNKRPNEFKEKYRKYDVLIMDDIQFLAGKEKSQEELFHLFNVLYENGKQIVFSSDVHPNLIHGLEERLKSRFNAGMIVDIVRPEFESRVVILKSKAEQRGISFSPEIYDFLAGLGESNIRELEGVINVLVCHYQLKKRSLTLEEVKTLTKNNNQPRKSASIKEVIRVVSHFYDIPEESIYEKTRRKEIVKPRQIIMYLLREDFGSSYPSIGEKLGGRDHTTVMHSCHKVRKDLEHDSSLIKEIEQLRTML